MPTTTRKKYKLDTASENEHASMMRSEAYDKLQEEVLKLREENKDLRSKNAVFRRASTRSKNHKAKMKKSKQETKATLQKFSKSTKVAAEKLLKENQKYKHLLEQKDQELEERDHEYNALLEEDDEERKDLSDQNVKLKQRVAASSRLDNQIRDETFHEAMSCAFVAIRDCFYNVVRRQGFNITVKLAYWQDELNMYLPDHKDNTKEEKINLCILAVSLFLVEVVNSQMVFGWPDDERIKAATQCYEEMPEPQIPEMRKKMKQWLSLTKEILTDIDQESWDAAQELLLKYVLDESQKIIEDWTDLRIDETIREELSEAVEPLLQTLCMVEYQKWQFTFELIPAMDEEERTSFDPAEMEGMFAEKTGWVKASIFPQLCRLEQDDRGDYKRTVICRARVAVRSNLPPITTAIKQDTKMSECTDDEMETDTHTTDSPGEEATDKSLDIVKRERSQSEDQDDMEKKLINEPMDEDPKIDALRAGSACIERYWTPEERISEGAIPDSYDRDEEVTIGESRGWPA